MKLLIMGPPGAGKGTQAKILSSKFNLIHLSTGDILRSEISKGSSTGIEAQSYMNAGNLVPDKVLLAMMETTLKNLNDKGLILDGFPRTIPQAEGLNTILKNNSQELDAVISLTADENELVERLIKRGHDSGRSDDTPEIIKQRQEVYWKQTSPLVDYYIDKNILIEIDGIGSINEIKNRILESLNSHA